MRPLEFPTTETTLCYRRRRFTAAPEAVATFPFPSLFGKVSLVFNYICFFLLMAVIFLQFGREIRNDPMKLKV